MKRPIRARLLGWLTNVVLLIAFAFGAMLIVPTVLGMRHYVILTGSMTGTYDRGSIIFDKAVPTKQLRVGDPITYSPPPGQTAHSQVTHRINRIAHGKDGIRIYGTKGDANRVQDPWKFQLPQPTQDKVVFHIPYAGYALGVLSDRHYRMYLLGIPALLVALSVIRGLFRDSREAALADAPGWGEVTELDPGHDPHGAPALATDVAAVFLALGHLAAAGDGRRRTAPRPALARGPRLAQLTIPERVSREEAPREAPRTAVTAGFVGLPERVRAPSVRRHAAGRRPAVARGPRVAQLRVPQLH